MPTPSTRPVFGSRTSLVRPSGRSTVIARLERAPRELGHLDLDALGLRLRLGQPGHAISGSVKTTAGNRQRLEHGLVAEDRFHGDTRFVRRLVREHRLARHVANGEDRRLRGAPLPSVSMNPFASILTVVVSRPGIFEFGRRPTATSTRSKICVLLGDVAFEGHPDAAACRRRTLTTFVFSMIEANSFFSRFSSTPTRSRSAPGSRPGVISTTETLLPSVA